MLFRSRPQKTQSIIILESHVICCTLSTSGGLLLESAFRGQGGVPFSCVIVDEVSGQSAERPYGLCWRCAGRAGAGGEPRCFEDPEETVSEHLVFTCRRVCARSLVLKCAADSPPQPNWLFRNWDDSLKDA